MTTESVTSKLPTELKHWKYEIERIGRKYGLDFDPNIIVMAGHEDISEFAAYSGYPVRYHHWRFGQESKRLKKSYRWGLHVIYEMVIPTMPCYSYFLDANPQVIQKAVIAHACIGHNDFFKNNAWFQDIPKNLHHRFGDNATKVEEIRREIGREKVDEFLEACISLDNVFDLTKPIILYEPKKVRARQEIRLPKRVIPKDKLPQYMEPYINTPEYLEAERQRIAQEQQREIDIERGAIIPAEPLRDILDFVLKYAPLEQWQQEIVRIIREESLSLMKGGQTKIMNEGWAAFWESTIMAGEGAAIDSEVCSFALIFAGVQRGSRSSINPYKLGKELWDEIKFRWDTGRYGPIYDNAKEALIHDRWEEFIIFKTLFDEHKGMTEAMLQEWYEFTTLVHETRENRGFIKKLFFLRHDWVLEWIRYKEAEQKIAELTQAFEEIRELEKQYPPYDEGDTARFTTGYQIMHSSTSPYRFWTSEELAQELRHYEFYRDLKRHITCGEISAFEVEIPGEWIQWAKKYELWGRLGQGLEKMFQVRSTYSDVTFIQDFFTEEFCAKHEYYTLGVGKTPQDAWYGEDHYLVKSRDYMRVKKFLISQFVNLGQPKILLLDANFHNNSELRLIHLHDGRDLCYNGCPNCGRIAPGIKEVLKRLHLIWNKEKAVHVETIRTIWPKRKPPWYDWRPPGYPPPEKEKPKYEWVRYTYSGSHTVFPLVFSNIDQLEKIRELLPTIPEALLDPKNDPPQNDDDD